MKSVLPDRWARKLHTPRIDPVAVVSSGARESVVHTEVAMGSRQRGMSWPWPMTKRG